MKFVVCLLLFLVGNPLWAESPITWRERFDVNRRLAFGKIRRHSTDEARTFYVLEGENRLARPQRVDPSLYADAPNEAMVGISARKSRKPRQPRARATATRRSSNKLPVDQLLEKSRNAYANGQLEEARRFYRLVQKAEPGSTEAAARLADIEKQLN